MHAYEVTLAVDDAAAAVYRGLRSGVESTTADGIPAWDDVVALACLLFEAGHDDAAASRVIALRRAEVADAELRELALALLAASGFDPGFRLAPQRLGRLVHAFETALRDVPAAWVRQDAPRFLVQEFDGREQFVIELADGFRQGNPVPAGQGDDPVGSLAAVADLLQETLMEQHWEAWPVCRLHGLGLHPEAVDGISDAARGSAGAGSGAEASPESGSAPGSGSGVAVWMCSGPKPEQGGGGGPHVVARIGELTVGSRQG